MEEIRAQAESTALVKISPRADEAVQALYHEGLKLAAWAEGRVIASNEDIAKATEDLGIIAHLKKAIETSRKEYTGPMNDHLKAINEAFKELIAPILQADTITRQKILAYQAEQDAKRKEEERINALRLEAARAESELKGELTEPVNLVPVTEAAPDHYRGGGATLGKMKNMQWKVVDFSLVPDEFKMLDATKITKLVKGGGTIPGIETWDEPTLRVNAPAAPLSQPSAQITNAEKEELPF